jgi:DNA polymerase-3 subunit gamma/tau
VTDLHTKYRPQTLDEVVGQESIVKSLDGLLKNRKRAPHAYLFLGPSGVGKTTLARVVANHLHIPRSNLTEIDGATFTGIEDAKAIRDLVSLPALSADKRKFLILDEVHSISDKAWQSWLKFVEEPPAHLYLAFCTTKPSKVPQTLRTRCHTYSLGEVSDDSIYEVLCSVQRREQPKQPLKDSVLEYIARSSGGSPRQALVYLSQCSGAELSLSEAKEIIRKVDLSADDEGAEVAIARMLVAGNDRWQDYMAALDKMKNVEAESIRIVTVNYVAAVMRKQKGDRAARLALVLEAFETTYNPSDRFAPLQLSIARCIFS